MSCRPVVEELGWRWRLYCFVQSNPFNECVGEVAVHRRRFQYCAVQARGSRMVELLCESRWGAKVCDSVCIWSQFQKCTPSVYITKAHLVLNSPSFAERTNLKRKFELHKENCSLILGTCLFRLYRVENGLKSLIEDLRGCSPHSYWPHYSLTYPIK